MTVLDIPDSIRATTCSCRVDVRTKTNGLAWGLDPTRNMWVCSKCQKPSPYHRGYETYSYNQYCELCETWYTVPHMPYTYSGMCPKCCERNGISV